MANTYIVLDADYLNYAVSAIIDYLSTEQLMFCGIDVTRDSDAADQIAKVLYEFNLRGVKEKRRLYYAETIVLSTYSYIPKNRIIRILNETGDETYDQNLHKLLVLQFFSIEALLRDREQHPDDDPDIMELLKTLKQHLLEEVVSTLASYQKLCRTNKLEPI